MEKGGHSRVVNGPHFEARTRPESTSPNLARHLFNYLWSPI